MLDEPHGIGSARRNLPPTDRRVRLYSLPIVAAFFFFSGSMAWSLPPRPRMGGGFWMQQHGGYRGGPPRAYGPGYGYGMHSAPSHQEHLPQWFHQHQALTPQQQERALHNEPGFNRLPPGEQQRLSNRLRQLDRMPPAERQRTLDRMEAIERLSPAQRQQLRSTVQQVTRMPEYRRHMMHKAFHDLSQMPPDQRQSIMNSPEFKGQFSPQERGWLGTLLNVQPYRPTSPASPLPHP